MDTAKRPSEVHASAVGTHTRNHFRNVSSPTQHRWTRNDERQPLVRHRSLGPLDEDDLANAKPVAGGTVLGIHNLAIVMPQFIASHLLLKQAYATDLRDLGCSCGKRDFQSSGRFCGLRRYKYIPREDRRGLCFAFRRLMHIGLFFRRYCMNQLSDSRLYRLARL